MTASRFTAIVALLFTYIATRVFWWCDTHVWPGLDSTMATSGLKLLLWVVPSLAALTLMHHIGFGRAQQRLGLDGGVVRGFAFGAIATAPLALAVIAGQHRAADVDVLVGVTLLGPLAEEVLFRGFLFRELHTHARWPLGWAIAVSALAFGLAHLDGLEEIARGRLGPVAVVATMAAGGAVFAWVFHRFGSLWFAVGLHGCLNLWLTLWQGDMPPRTTLRLDAVGVAQLLSFGVALALTFRRGLASKLPAAQPS